MPGYTTVLVPQGFFRSRQERQINIKHKAEERGDAGGNCHEFKTMKVSSAPNPIAAFFQPFHMISTSNEVT